MKRASPLPGAVSWIWMTGLILASLVVSFGTFWAFQRGANDFSVFFESWRLVLSGHGADVYHRTPDRFLYAPGFAWIFAPLGLLPRDLALALWCFAKAAVIGLLIRGFGMRLSAGRFPDAIGVGAWGVVLCARPILIDFQYGQVNAFVLGACAWALLNHFGRETRNAKPGSTNHFRDDFWNTASWAVLGIAACVKLFPLPLLLVPFFVTKHVPGRKIRFERIGAFVGIALVALIPLCTQGLRGTWELLLQWKAALISRGLPLESHNQSFAAFVNHYFSGSPTHIIANGIDHPALLGGPWFSPSQITALSLAWTLIWTGFVLGWILTGSSKPPLRWVGVLIALLILPSHLIWKPYFVMGLPMAILAAARWRELWPVLTLFFVVGNFSGFDWVGPVWGARLEAGAALLWLHLLLLGVVALPPDKSPANFS